MRNELVNANSDLVNENDKYIMKITGDDKEGKNELDNFTDPEQKYPVIATTSKLLSTGIDAQTCKLIVLDSNIRSMTEFKQMIGRGTRINEEYGKRYFTILDFRNVTDLFSDREFDGDPVRVKPVGQNDDISGIEDEEQNSTESYIDIDGEEVIGYEEFSGEGYETVVEGTEDFTTGTETTDPGPRRKIYVNGVDVSVLNERELYFDIDGKPVTMSLRDFTRMQILEKYSSLDEFLRKWNNAERKEAIINELAEQGILVDELLQAVNRECDLFDIICHVGYDMPPLTRRERVNNVKKRNYFTKYEEKARLVLEALLDKYADEGVQQIEDIKILKIKPFDRFGSPMEILSEFGDRPGYLEAVRELEKEIYELRTS